MDGENPELEDICLTAWKPLFKRLSTNGAPINRWAEALAEQCTKNAELRDLVDLVRPLLPHAEQPLSSAQLDQLQAAIANKVDGATGEATKFWLKKYIQLTTLRRQLPTNEWRNRLMAEEAARNALSPNTEACGSNKRAKDCDEADDISLQTTQKRSRKGNENETDEREEAAKEQEEDDKDEKEEEEEEQKKAAKPSALIVTGDSTTNTTAICSTSLATPRPAITRFSFFLEPTLTSGLLGRTMGCFERLKGAVQYHEGRRKLLLGPKLEPESKRLPLDLLIHATHISCALNIIRRDDDGFLHFEGKVPTQYTSDSPLVWFAFCPSEPLKGHELFKSNASSVYGPVVFKFKRAAFDVMTVKHGYKLYKLGTREYGREFCHTYVFSKAPIQLLENFLFDEKNPKPKEKDKRYLISSPKAEQRLPADWGWQWRPAPPQGGYEQTDLAVCCDKEGQLLISYDHLEAIEIRQHTLCIFQGSKRDECQLGTNIARGDHNHNALYSHICGLLPDDQKHKVILC